MGLVEDFADVAVEFLCAALLVVLGAGRIGQVTLAFDIGVLEVVCPSTDLASAAFGKRSQI
jgi:hypothetical protein